MSCGKTHEKVDIVANVDIIATITKLKSTVSKFFSLKRKRTFPISCAKLPVPAKVEASKHTSSSDISVSSGSKKVDIL